MAFPFIGKTPLWKRRVNNVDFAYRVRLAVFCPLHLRFHLGKQDVLSDYKGPLEVNSSEQRISGAFLCFHSSVCCCWFGFGAEDRTQGLARDGQIAHLLSPCTSPILPFLPPLSPVPRLHSSGLHYKGNCRQQKSKQSHHIY